MMEKMLGLRFAQSSRRSLRSFVRGRRPPAFRQDTRAFARSEKYMAAMIFVSGPSVPDLQSSGYFMCMRLSVEQSVASRVFR